MFTEQDKATLGRKLTASDVAYFEASAENSPCLGGVLSRVPGFPGLSLACVLHSLLDIDDIERWIPQLESIIATRGCNWVRFYLHELSDHQRACLTKRSYRELIELGFATKLDATSLDPHTCRDVILKPCHSEADWQQCINLSLLSGQGPDGFDMAGDSYVRVSRLKVDAGYMSPYLAFLHDKAVGFVNLAFHANFARGKNLLVHPEHRNQGVGFSIVKAAMTLAQEQGAQYFGCYAIDEEPSVALYSSLGMVEVTRQYEWSKHLDGS